jgi:uncharacterized Zn-finger protein
VVLAFSLFPSRNGGRACLDLADRPHRRRLRSAVSDTQCFFGLRAIAAVVRLARQLLTIMQFKLLPGRKKDSVKVVPLVKIIEVKCPKCQRKFRTVPAVVEHAGEFYCPVCSSRMKVSEPQPVSVLARKKASSAA